MEPLVELQSFTAQVAPSLLKQQHVVIHINESSSSLLLLDCWKLHPVGFSSLDFPSSQLVHSEASSALNTWWTSGWFQAGTLSPQLTSFILYSDWSTAGCQRSAVILWSQLWSPTPPIWNIWTWAGTTTCRIQEWSICVVFWRVQTAACRLWGQTSCFICVLRWMWCKVVVTLNCSIRLMFYWSTLRIFMVTSAFFSSALVLWPHCWFLLNFPIFPSINQTVTNTYWLSDGSNSVRSFCNVCSDGNIQTRCHNNSFCICCFQRFEQVLLLSVFQLSTQCICGSDGSWNN